MNIVKKDNKMFKNFFNFKKSEVVQSVQSFGNKTSNFFRNYQLGQQFNSQANWNPSLNSEMLFLKNNFEKMIARSRDLHRNSPLAKKFISMYITNVLGANGFKFQSKTYDFINGDYINDDKANSIIEKNYLEWQNKENCDITENLTHQEQIEVMVKSLLTDGEIFYLKIKEKPSAKNKYGFKIQILDPQRVDIKYDENLRNGNYIRSGVELDRFGKVIAYHLREYDAGLSSFGTYTDSKRVRLLKGDAELVFEKIFPEQIRGLPCFHAVGKFIKELEDYNDATMSAAKLGASLSVYLEKTESAQTGEFANKDEDGSFYLKKENTEILSMPSGFKVNAFQGNYPSDVYQIYTKRMIQLISAGLNVSPLFLGNDTEDVNYSTSKTVLAYEQDNWKQKQNFIIENVCTPIFLSFLKHSLLYETLTNDYNIRLNIERFNKYKEHKFYGRTWDGIDKEGDTKNNLLMEQNNLITKTEICANLGKDYEDILKIKQREKELETKYGIVKEENII